ncbi:centromere protein J-like isoform X2 [Mercenaria mercenaria]|uniref:centromere protein J-like isoform X2 n=1 Tax=Mercenaria mercenaria TaxID=6596 RepID=UPI00234FA8CD|nr:centromere protein J-like isoform X2 [Mercenaria mercenaria]
MDNSFGSRPPWPGRPMGLPAQSYGGNLQPGMDLSYGTHSVQPRPPLMNGYAGVRPGITTPSSVGGGYPMWDMDIPSQMFMQAMNFDRMMQQQQQGMTDPAANMSAVSSRSTDDASQRSEAGRDLIEQQQAVEQVRLLQRFKELRQWQQQQQEVLMSQQHQQLSLLRKEQEKMQGMITKQRDNQWGGGHPNFYGNTETPPRRQIPPGTDVSKFLEPAVRQEIEGQHILPKPVMYVQPKEDDDEIKTNPDLFSDTNSNRGSQAGMEEGMFPIPDSASEASVEIGLHQMRQGQVKNLSQFRQRFNPHELDAPKKLHRSFAELEHDPEFLNLSSQSPTMLEMQHGTKPDTRNDKIEEEDEHTSDDEESDEDDSDDASSDDDDESDENQEDTQIEVKTGGDIDELPIKPGIEGGKTFEQLLEEQLKAEEDRLKQANASQDSPSQPKRTFLKKGEGIARFESKPGQRPHKTKKKSSGSHIGSQASHKQTSQKSENTGAQTKPASKSAGKPPTHSKTRNQPGKKTTGQGSKQQKSDDKKKPITKSPSRDTGKQTIVEISTEEDKLRKGKMKRADSFPDDASFVANLKERQKESERDMEELDEFEILEHFADNMSFCSNSSIVTKGLHGLQNDRILTGVLPKSQEIGRATSPRAALIKKLEEEKKAKHKKQLEEQSNIKHGGVRTDTRSDYNTVSSVGNILKVGDGQKNEHLKSDSKAGTGVSVNQGKNDDDDEYESVSDSSDDSSDESSSDDGDDKITKNVQKDTHGDSKHFGGKSDYFKTLSHNESHSKGKNDSVCSTDKKLERVLSYTGFTESGSVSQTSESEQEVESEDDEYDFSAGGQIENREPAKPLTRKVAGRDDKNKFPFQNLPSDKDLLQFSLNGSAFAPKAKSPIVISKERVPKQDTLGSVQHEVLKETKFSYHSDSDSVGNKQNGSFSEEDDDRSNDGDRNSRKSFGEKKTLQFDDDDEWGDLTPKILKSRRRKESENEHDKTLVEDCDTDRPVTGLGKPEIPERDSEDTPPTSKLVSKLFPSLKPAQKKQEEQNLEKIQSVAQASTGDGVQSKILRDKLMELEREIEKFRNENKHLATLRNEREQGLTVLKKEITEFEKEKAMELKRIEEFRNEEMKKLKHERKMFDKYQKAARAGPDKKEREEIENLRSQLSELQEEMKRKESRWTANNARLRDKIDQVEQENEELKEEIKLLEKKRLEWMQKDQKNKPRTSGQTVLRSSTPTEELEQMINGHVEHGYNDLSASATMRSTSSLKPSQQQPKANIRSSFPPPPKQTTHNQTQSTHNKPSNVNQSTKSNVNHSSAKLNQSKKNNTHNAKQGHSVHGQGHSSKPGHKATGRSNSSVTSGKISNSSDNKNVLRNSLAEDLPRRELGTIAEPQDLSIYSETDGDGLSAPVNMPRKFAPRPGVDKSVIDKGDNDEYDEIQHSDGKVERTYRNGAREILFSNGTRKEISADGKSIVVSFFNGDMKQIMPDQRVIYYYAENQTTHTNYPDGLEIIQFPNQQTEKLYPDGTKEITFPDQTIKYIFPNGSEESIFPDGTVIRLEKNGDKTMEFPNGQREIHTQEYKKREYPDGTVKTVYPDGRQETRYSNGRLRVKDKDGNVIVDRQC